MRLWSKRRRPIVGSINTTPLGMLRPESADSSNGFRHRCRRWCGGQTLAGGFGVKGVGNCFDWTDVERVAYTMGNIFLGERGPLSGKVHQRGRTAIARRRGLRHHGERGAGATDRGGLVAAHQPTAGRRFLRGSLARDGQLPSQAVYRMWRVGVSSTPLGSNPGKNVSTHLGQIVYDSWRSDAFAPSFTAPLFSASRHQAHTIFIVPNVEQVVCRVRGPQNWPDPARFTRARRPDRHACIWNDESDIHRSRPVLHACTGLRSMGTSCSGTGVPWSTFLGPSSCSGFTFKVRGSRFACSKLLTVSHSADHQAMRRER